MSAIEPNKKPVNYWIVHGLFVGFDRYPNSFNHALVNQKSLHFSVNNGGPIPSPLDLEGRATGDRFTRLDRLRLPVNVAPKVSQFQNLDILSLTEW